MAPHTLRSRFCLLQTGWILWFFLAVLVRADAAPAAPTKLRGAVTASNAVTLRWDDNSTDETNFEIAYTANGVTQVPLIFGASTGTGTIGVALTITAGIPYTFRIRAYTTSTANASAYSNTITVTTGDFSVPTSPGVVVQADGSMLVFWTDSAFSEAGYFVELGTAPGGPFTTAGNTGANFTGFIIGELGPATTYYFRIRGFKGTAASPTATTAYTSVVSATTPATIAAPSGLAVTPISERAVSLSFADNTANNTGYEIEFRASGGGAFTYLGEIGDATGASTAPILFPGTAYEFQVRAFYQNGENPRVYSAYSNTAGATTPFNAPTGLTVTPISETAVNLAFADNSAANTGYEIEIRPAGGVFSYFGQVADITNVNTNSVLAPGTTFDFRVRAYFQSGANPRVYSAYSDIGTATTPFHPPTNLVVTPSADTPYRISFSWTDHSAVETGYELEYRKQGVGSFVTRKVTAANATGIANLPEFEPGTVYEFRIRARAGGLRSAYFPSVDGIVATTRDGFSSKSYAPIQAGTPFGYQMATISQSPRTAWSVGTLPPGLTFDEGTGVISGIPTAAGIYAVPMTASFAGGPAHTLNLTLRIIRPPAAPQLTAAIGPQTITRGAAAAIALDTKFADPDTESAARMATSKGNVDIVLYSITTPQTVANFLAYNYSDVLFHRAPPGFVVQGGGYRTYAAPDVFEHIATSAPVPNEPGIANTFGTVAMAKVADDPDSATSEFFFNVGNNSANLDNQNGGFTVFGRIATPSLGTTVAALASVPTANYAVKQYVGPLPTDVVNATFTDLPIDQSPVPTAVEQSSLVKTISVTPLPALTYAVSENSNPAVAGASIVGNSLQLDGLAPGLTTITVVASDVDGNATPATFTVEVRETLAQWAAGQGVPPGEAGAGDNPDRDALTNLQEWAFFANPNIAETGNVLPAFALTPVAGSQHLEITFPVRKFAANLTYSVEVSGTLLPGSWTTIWTNPDGFAAPAVTSAVDQADRTVVTVRDPVPDASATQRFMRIRVQ
jgi:cyclophilin family peptidyl-prolyl cis-trans isomerase